MDFAACAAWYTPLDISNNIAARPGDQKASAGWTKVAMGYSDNVCYFSWLNSVLGVPSSVFYRR